MQFPPMSAESENYAMEAALIAQFGVPASASAGDLR
jgi:hypothetical protein